MANNLGQQETTPRPSPDSMPNPPPTRLERISKRLEIPFSLLPGYGLAIVAACGTLCIALLYAPSCERRATQVLLFIAGGAAGWIFGLLLSPISEPETKQFQRLLRILTTFISGVVLGKFANHLDHPRAVLAALSPQTIPILIPTVTFLLGALCSYMPRAAAVAEPQRLAVERKSDGRC
jgi:hypothetical protein